MKLRNGFYLSAKWAIRITGVPILGLFFVFAFAALFSMAIVEHGFGRAERAMINQLDRGD